MTVYAPFQGNLGENIVVTPSAISASSTISAKNKSVRLVNSGANIVHVRIGEGAQTATTSDLPVLSGESIVVQKSQYDDTVAYISSVGTTLHIQAGEGGY